MFTKEALAQAMKAQKIRAKELAKISGVSESTISRLLSGAVREPSNRVTEDIERALGCSLSETSETPVRDESTAMTNSLSVDKAAALMGKSKEFVRIGLQDGALPFGCAVKMSGQWSYYISPVKFCDFTGQSIDAL